MAMRRANLGQAGSSACRSCGLARTQLPRQQFVRPVARLPIDRVSHATALRPGALRWARSASSAAKLAATTTPKSPSPDTTTELAPADVTTPADIASKAEDSLGKFLSVDGIPAKDLTNVALESCLRAATALHPHRKKAEAHSRATVSRLAALGAERTGARLPIDAKVNEAINRVSKCAFTIMAEPNVEITPELLDVYVHVQWQLGRPESIPTVFEMYATKRKPVLQGGEVRYVAANPNMPSKAIETDVAELALRTAIDAKHLDAALGVVAASFALPAYKRQKMVKQLTAPAIGVALLPFGVFGLASAYAAHWQNVVEPATATLVAALGVSGYFLAVGGLGLIAKLSYKDQMRRVTWAPGTPLRYRWVREEERAALDAVACAWGFKETWRHGEETGAEWEGLRDYMGFRQMILDRVEFMEGMS